MRHEVVTVLRKMLEQGEQFNGPIAVPNGIPDKASALSSLFLNKLGTGAILFTGQRI